MRLHSLFFEVPLSAFERRLLLQSLLQLWHRGQGWCCCHTPSSLWASEPESTRTAFPSARRLHRTTESLPSLDMVRV